MKDINEILSKTRKYRKRRKIECDDIPLSDRYFGIDRVERRDPLIKHPCIHLLGRHE